MNEAALKAELKAQVARVQECEREIDRLHQEISAQRDELSRREAAPAEAYSAVPAAWLSKVIDGLDMLQGAVTRLPEDLSRLAIHAPAPSQAALAPLTGGTQSAAPADGSLAGAMVPASAMGGLLGRLPRTVPARRLRTHRATLVPHPLEADAARLTANEEDGQHSAVYVIRPTEGQALAELRVIAAPAGMQALRLRLSPDGPGWSLVLPCHLDTGRCGRLRSTGAAPAAESASRNLPGGWREFVISFPVPVAEPVVLSLILSRDLSKTSAHFVGNTDDTVDLHSLTVVQAAQVELDEPFAAPEALPQITSLSDTSAAVSEAVGIELQGSPIWTTPAPPERVLLKGKLQSPTKTAQLFEDRRKLEAAFAQSNAARRIEALRDTWKGGRAFIVGNGPSLKHQDLLPLRDELTFFTNWGFLHPDYERITPKFHCSSSHEIFGGWGKADPQLNKDFAASFAPRAAGVRKVFSWRFEQSLRNSGDFNEDELDFLLFDRPKFLIDEIGHIDLDMRHVMHDGYTVVITFCIPLAVHLGVKEIYLLGCDCDYGIKQASDPKQYFYPTELHKTSTSAFDSLDRIWADNGPVFQTYELVERQLREVGVRLFNATHGGRLNNIPRVSYESLITQASAA
jgi:hypothetical protein